MLKQGITINTKFIWTHALSQLSFTKFRPYAISFLGLVLSLTLIPKSKKTLEISLEVMSSFKTSVDAMAKVLVWTVDYLENWHYNFIQKKYGRKRCLPCTHVLLSGQQFFYLYRLFTSLMTPSGKQESVRLSPNSLNSFHDFFLFWFKGLCFKTQFKIEFWPSVNRGQLGLEQTPAIVGILFQITAKLQKYDSFLLNCTSKISADCFVLEILTVDRFQNQICIVSIIISADQEKENKTF